MSKSADSPLGCVMVVDPPKTIEKKIKSAVTDSGSDVHYDREEKPGISNLIEIYAAVTGETIVDVEHEFEGKQYGAFKSAVADAVVAFLQPLQKRYEELVADPAEVDGRLARGADIAESIADPVLARASRAAGLLPRPSR
jgi:tryptophanyl-tRNA synthetase